MKKPMKYQQGAKPEANSATARMLARIDKNQRNRERYAVKRSVGGASIRVGGGR